MHDPYKWDIAAKGNEQAFPMTPAISANPKVTTEVWSTRHKVQNFLFQAYLLYKDGRMNERDLRIDPAAMQG